MVAVENAKTVERAARLLFELADRPDGCTATELAALLGTQRPPLYRLLSALESYRLIARDDAKVYRLGVGVLELSRGVSGPLEALARPALQRAADATDASAMLILAEGDALVTLMTVTPSAPGVHLTAPAGFRHPDGRTPPRIAVEMIGPARADEDKAVSEARVRGYAASRGLTSPGRSAVAAPLSLGRAHPAACVLLVFAGEPDLSSIGGAAMTAASEISEAARARESL